MPPSAAFHAHAATQLQEAGWPAGQVRPAAWRLAAAPACQRARLPRGSGVLDSRGQDGLLETRSCRTNAKPVPPRRQSFRLEGVAGAGGGGASGRGAVLLLLLLLLLPLALPEAGQRLHFGVLEQGAVDALENASAAQKEHVALAEQLFGTRGFQG